MKFIKGTELNRADLKDYKALTKMPVVIVLDNLRSGLNTGSVFRTADSFFAEKIFLCGITAQPPEREVLKSALGATEAVAWEYFKDTSEALRQLKISGYNIFAVEQSDSSIMLNDFVPQKGEKYALIFGNEVKGVDDQLIDLIDHCIEVPQSGTKHSLNVSVCAGVVLWRFYEKLIL